MPYLTALRLNGSRVPWIVVSLTAAMLEAFYIFCVWLRIYPVPWISSFSWLHKTFASCLPNIFIKSYKCNIVNSTCKSRVHGCLGKESSCLNLHSIHCFLIMKLIILSLQISPTRCTILLNIFISLLYMFRASMCLSSGGNYCIYATLVFVTLYGWWLDWNWLG